MKYAHTEILNGVETVRLTLPLSSVPGFDPENAPPRAYLVEEAVQRDWIKQPNGTFLAPPLS